MRRSGRPIALVSSVVVLALVAWPAVTTAQSPGADASEAVGPRGGRLSMALPADGLPAGADVRVVALDPAAPPAGLEGVPSGWASFALEPLDATFGVPVTLRRSLGFEELGVAPFDPLFDGLALGTLFTRAADGTWSWLDGLEVRLDLAGSAFTVTGSTDHGGPILAWSAGDLLVGTEDGAPSAVGTDFRVEGQLRADPGSSAAIATVAGRTSDEAIATAGDAYPVEGFAGAVGLAYHCLAPGTVTYETSFTVSGVGDVGPITDATGLKATDVTVVQAGEHTCQ